MATEQRWVHHPQTGIPVPFSDMYSLIEARRAVAYDFAVESRREAEAAQRRADALLHIANLADEAMAYWEAAAAVAGRFEDERAES